MFPWVAARVQGCQTEDKKRFGGYIPETCVFHALFTP
jgi:hypothetical protein